MSIFNNYDRMLEDIIFSKGTYVPSESVYYSLATLRQDKKKIECSMSLHEDAVLVLQGIK